MLYTYLFKSKWLQIIRMSVIPKVANFLFFFKSFLKKDKMDNYNCPFLNLKYFL